MSILDGHTVRHRVLRTRPVFHYIAWSWSSWPSLGENPGGVSAGLDDAGAEPAAQLLEPGGLLGPEVVPRPPGGALGGHLDPVADGGAFFGELAVGVEEPAV